MNNRNRDASRPVPKDAPERRRNTQPGLAAGLLRYHTRRRQDCPTLTCIYDRGNLMAYTSNPLIARKIVDALNLTEHPRKH